MLDSLVKFFNFDEPAVRLKPKEPSATAIDSTPLAHYLPYEGFDEETQLYLNEQSIGFVLSLSTLLGANDELIGSLHNLLIEELPSESLIEILLFADSDIDEALTTFSQCRSQPGGAYQQLAQMRADFLRQGARDGLGCGQTIFPRDFKCYLVVSRPRKEVSSVMSQLQAALALTLNSLKSMGFSASVVAPDDFLQLVRKLLNPAREADGLDPAWSPLDPLWSQVGDVENSYEVSPESISLNDTHEILNLTVTKFPSEWAGWGMTELLGSSFNRGRQIPCPFLLKLTFMAHSKEVSQRRAMTKTLSSTRTTGNGLLRLLIPEVKKIADNWQFANERLGAGDSLVSMLFQVVLFPKKSRAAEAEQLAKRVFQEQGWRLKKPNKLQLPSFLTALPMGCDEGRLKDMRFFGLVSTRLGFNAINCAPMLGEAKGCHSPLINLVGRRGQLLWWDPFVNPEGNYNIAIAGKSGSGKSVFLQELETAIVGAGGQVFVIDIGRSSEKTCRLLGGEFIAFSLNSQMSLNPFTHIQNIKESLSMLKPLLAKMSSPSGKTTDFENALLEQALVEVWEARGCATEIEDIANWLLSHQDVRAQDLGVMLYPYTPAGSFGHFFTNACTIDLSNPFIVIDLEGLSEKPDLQEVVLYQLMYHVTETMYRGDRKRKIACVIDEAWSIFKSELGATFIETGYRRARKYQGSFISGTQDVADYYEKAASTAAISNSDWLCLLSHNNESIETLKNSGKLEMTPFLEQQLKSVHTVDKEYAEILIKGPGMQAIGRLLLEPYSRLLFSSKGEEFAAVNDLLEQGFSVAEAIAELSGQGRLGSL